MKSIIKIYEIKIHNEIIQIMEVLEETLNKIGFDKFCPTIIS